MEHASAAQDMCILVVSCDKYADCWEPFSLCLQKFWPDCPYPVYLATETKEAPCNTIYKKAIHSQNKSWTGLLREVCNQISTEYIFLVLEDHWLADTVRTDKIAEVLGVLQQNTSVGLVYLDFPQKKSPIWKNDSSFYEILPNTAYRLSAGPSIWRKNFLLLTCNDDIDAWNFERLKSFDPSTFSYTVLSCCQSRYKRVDVSGAILRRKWQSFVPKFAKEENLPIDFSQRQIMSFQDNVKLSIKSFIFNLNPALIVKVQNWLYYLRHKEK